MAANKNINLKAKQEKKITANHDVKRCPHKLNNKFIHAIPKTSKDGKEVVTVYNADGTRELMVPDRKPIDIPGIFASSEFNRLKKQSHVVTLQDRMNMIEQAESQKEQRQYESDARKKQLAKAQVQNKANRGGKLDTVDSDAKNKNTSLLRRSHEMILENEEQIKEANRVIMARKCHFIRNAQIAEKELIKKQMHEEENRLDLMMEQYRQRYYKIEEQKREEAELEKQKVFEQVTNQIKENELFRLVEAERIQEESKILNKVLIAVQREKEIEEYRKRQKQLELQKDMMQSYNEIQEFKKIQEEEQRISDLRIQAFLKKKQALEDARLEEEKMIKQAKEQEIARIGAAQKKAQDKQAAQDELNALRNLEEKERLWRESEKQKALKRQEDLDNLKKAREQQIEDIQKSRAITLARDKIDFEKNVRVQYEQYRKDEKERKEKKELARKNNGELLKQIYDKEKEKIEAKRGNFEDGNAQRCLAEAKDRQIEEYLKQKVQKLRDCKFPEAYINDIEKQLKLV